MNIKLMIVKHINDIPTKDYLGGIEFIADEAKYISHANGRIIFGPEGTLKYQYNITDHLDD